MRHDVISTIVVRSLLNPGRYCHDDVIQDSVDRNTNKDG